MTVLVLTTWMGVASAQPRRDDPTPEPARAETPAPQAESKPDSPPTDGFWPTPKLMDLMLRRAADDFGEDYELDDEQRDEFREGVVKRWGTFLTENRSKIQPVFNEFLEMRLSPEPPTKPQLQEWAGRAMPVLKEFRKQIDEGSDEFRRMLPPAQRAKFELRRLQMTAGLAYAEAKLTLASEGKISEDDRKQFWEPPGRQRRGDGRRRAEAAESKAAADEPPDQIAEELKGWDDYVASFMSKYDLDEGQRNAALSFLAELRLRATTHRDTHRAEIDRVERRIASFDGADKELGELQAQLKRLYGPIDEMFGELKRRLDALPTAAQRAAVNHAPKPSDP